MRVYVAAHGRQGMGGVRPCHKAYACVTQACLHACMQPPHMPAQPAGVTAGLWKGCSVQHRRSTCPAPLQNIRCLLRVLPNHAVGTLGTTARSCASCGDSRQPSTPSSLDCPGRATVGMRAALQNPKRRLTAHILWTHCNITVAFHLHLKAAVQKQRFAIPCRQSPGAGNCHQRQHARTQTHTSPFQVHTANQNRHTYA